MASPAASSKTRGLQAGQIIDGKYLIERKLGEGGMGVVVCAKHVELQTRVAIKVMSEQAATDGESVARFQREARAAVKLRSLHAARVLDVGRLPSGTPYLVMEYLEGHDLDTVLHREGRLDIDHACGLILQACEGIADAHAQGIIHRDLKPRNLFVTRNVDGSVLVKVVDFGLAKEQNLSLGPHSLTATNAIMGSPQYMSPEQLRASKKVDARTDIWSLGVTLYELLAGRVPFEAEVITELCVQVLTLPPTPLRSLRPDVPEALEAVVMKCLEKDPSGRYENVGELARALATFVPDERGTSQRILQILASQVVFDDTALASSELDVRPIPASARSGVLATQPPGQEARIGAGEELDGRSAGSAAALPLMLPRRRPKTVGIAASIALVVAGVGGLVALRSFSQPVSAERGGYPLGGAAPTAHPAAPPEVEHLAVPSGSRPEVHLGPLEPKENWAQANVEPARGRAPSPVSVAPTRSRAPRVNPRPAL